MEVLDRCVMCGRCLGVCSHNAIIGMYINVRSADGGLVPMADSFKGVVVDEMKCNCCGDCRDICPTNALTNHLFNYCSFMWDDNGPGGPGGAGNSSPYSSFRMSDTKSKTEIPELLDELLNDCPGSNLIDALNKKVELRFKYDPNHKWPASYNNSSKTITWSEINDYILLEELFHAYQYMTGAFNTALRGNMELEAKVFVSGYYGRLGKVFYNNMNMWRDVGVFANNPNETTFRYARTYIANYYEFTDDDFNWEEYQKLKNIDNLSRGCN